MLDKERVLCKIDELDGYLEELKQISPENFVEYQKVEKKRSCERLLQLAVECVIDICKLFVSGLRLGLPAGEDDLIDKVRNKKIISLKMARLLKQMRGFRNILVHEYAQVDDRMVYQAVKRRTPDFEMFKNEILKVLKQ